MNLTIIALKALVLFLMDKTTDNSKQDGIMYTDKIR